jgi:hypothetical protein
MGICHSGTQESDRSENPLARAHLQMTQRKDLCADKISASELIRLGDCGLINSSKEFNLACSPLVVSKISTASLNIELAVIF